MSSASAGKKFLLTGGDQQDLRRYVNSEVEVRGTLAKSSSSPYGSGSAAGTSSSTGSSTGTGSGSGTSTGSGSSSGMGSSSSMSGDHQTLRITSVRQVSSSCTSNR
jgi:hypothetical protein